MRGRGGCRETSPALRAPPWHVASRGREARSYPFARPVRRYAASLGSKVSPIDGSGLTITNRSSAADVVTLLNRARRSPYGKALFDSLPVAGRDGTLADRMKGTAAAGRCHAKTGTLTGVSALSGYCYNRSGRKFAFSILMNSVRDTYGARAAQDRIAALIAGL